MHYRLHRSLLVAIALLLAALAGCQPTPEEWYGRGVLAIEKNDWAGAARAFAKAGRLADAQERAADALTHIETIELHLDAARSAMRQRRWYDAYVTLEHIAALDPAHRAVQTDLPRVIARLDARYAQAEQSAANDDYAHAAELYGDLGDYRSADALRSQMVARANELDALYDAMQSAADRGDWETALDRYKRLFSTAPNYRDIDRLGQRYLERTYRAAEQALSDGHDAEALRLLSALLACDGGYRSAQRLAEEARQGAGRQLVGVHPLNRVVGTDRGWTLQLDSVEVRPEGDLLVRVTVTNSTTIRNHLACLQNDDERPRFYLLAANGQRLLPTQWACQQWRQEAWTLEGGESTSFWWLFPAPPDITAPFTLSFADWGDLEVSIYRP